MTKKKPDQATRDHNQAVSDVKNKRGFREPIGFVKEHFFGNAKERNGNYRKGYDYQKKR